MSRSRWNWNGLRQITSGQPPTNDGNDGPPLQTKCLSHSGAKPKFRCGIHSDGPTAPLVWLGLTSTPRATRHFKCVVCRGANTLSTGSVSSSLSRCYCTDPPCCYGSC